MGESQAGGNTYDERNIETMESVYGEGFMSPGGAAEVAEIARPVPLEGRRVLDLGCGLGGASVALARLEPDVRLVGLDIEPSVLRRARTLVANAGLESRIEIVHASPGPVPFDHETFDHVYANSVTCHFRDLVSLLTDVRRVLQPGGRFFGAEWLVDDNEAAFRQWDDLLRERGLSFFFVRREQFEAALVEAGYEAVTLRQRRAEIGTVAERALAAVEDELSGELRMRLGTEGYQAFLGWTRARAAVLSQGGMYHCHFYATKPL